MFFSWLLPLCVCSVYTIQADLFTVISDKEKNVRIVTKMCRSFQLFSKCIYKEMPQITNGLLYMCVYNIYILYIDTHITIYINVTIL